MKAKNGKEKKPARITAEQIATAKAAGLMTYPLARIKAACKTTWAKAVQIRHELLKKRGKR
jgi:hypothetical protein